MTADSEMFAASCLLVTILLCVCGLICSLLPLPPPIEEDEPEDDCRS